VITDVAGDVGLTVPVMCADVAITGTVIDQVR
jgi:hypothetical protein